jgi:thiamine kinase-like enzyme
LQIEYIESSTLRDELIKNDINLEVISNLFDSTFSIYEKYNKKTFESDFSKAFSHLGALSTSGPVQTKDMKVSFVDKLFNRILLRILRYKMKNFIKRLDLTKLKTGFSHGDMHYNNILVTENQEVKLIDFENISHKGYYDFDLIYLFVMTELYLSEKKYLEIKESVISKICKDEKNLFEVIKLYRIAVLSNKRFQVECDVRVSKLELILKLINNININFKEKI